MQAEIHSSYDAGVRVDRRGGKVAVVTFGSRINLGKTDPTFAFEGTLRRIRGDLSAFDTIFLRSRGNDWYTGGIEGLGVDVATAATALSGLIAAYDATLFIGNSMGAYAALKFGLLNGADRVIAFSPQTNIEEPFLNSVPDRRWRRDYEQVWAEGHDGLDLAALPLDARRSEVTLHVGAASPEDVAHARHLADRLHLALIESPDEGHDLVHAYRRSGALDTLVRQALAAIGCTERPASPIAQPLP